MDVKVFLRSYRPALLTAVRAAEKLDDARAAGVKSQTLDGMPRAGGGNGLDEQVARIDALERRFFRERETALEIAERIQDMIDSLENFEQKSVLRLRYLEGMTWDEIGTAVYMGRSTVIRIHGRALEELMRSRKWDAE